MLFSTVFYLLGGFVTAALITFFIVLFKPAHHKKDSKSWVVFAWVFTIVLAGPYMGVEYFTRTKGKLVEKAVKEAYAAAGVEGPLQYFKIIWIKGDHAKAFAVGKEKQDWGGYDTPVIQVNLVEKNGEWKAESFKSLNWDRKNKDSIVFPPYW